MLINNLFENVKINSLIFLRLKNPITYNENNKLDIIFALITPKNIKTGPKLQMLSIISRILKKPNIRKKIRGAKKAEDILALLLPSI
jgi:mannitol/fructose-specific phosphotransferase system IIA component (Ntr-type)